MGQIPIRKFKWAPKKSEIRSLLLYSAQASAYRLSNRILYSKQSYTLPVNFWSVKGWPRRYPAIRYRFNSTGVHAGRRGTMTNFTIPVSEMDRGVCSSWSGWGCRPLSPCRRRWWPAHGDFWMVMPPYSKTRSARTVTGRRRYGCACPFILPSWRSSWLTPMNVAGATGRNCRMVMVSPYRESWILVTLVESVADARKKKIITG